jgi:hypothetical protein
MKAKEMLNVIPEGAECRRIAGEWYYGDGSALYALASSGSIVEGLEGEINEIDDAEARGDMVLDLFLWEEKRLAKEG